MSAGRGPRVLAMLACGVGLSVGQSDAARAPDIVKKSFQYRGASAEAIARVLQLPADRPATVTFELSQAAEHRALPERDAALRDADGTLSSELAWRTSDKIQVAVTWQPKARLLRIEGYVHDLSTSSFGNGRLRWGFGSPGFVESEIDRYPGWKALFLTLRSLTAKPGQSPVLDERTIETDLDGCRRIVASLTRMNTWNSRNEPVQMTSVGIAFGPTLGRSRKCE